MKRDSRMNKRLCNDFCNHSTGNGPSGYYATKGHGVAAFASALQAVGLDFEPSDCNCPGDEGSIQPAIIDADTAIIVGYARLTWYRMPSGKYEFVGYIS